MTVSTSKYYDRDLSFKRDSGHGIASVITASPHVHGFLQYWTGLSKLLSSLEIGVVSTGEEFTVYVQNYSSSSVVVTSIVQSSELPFSYSGIAVGTYLLPYEKKEITFTVLNSSPIAIIYELSVSTTGSDNNILRISGSVGIFYQERFQEGAVETIEFLTSVITAADGGEYRTAIRSYPRTGIAATSLGTNLRKAWHQALYATANEPIVVARWWEEVQATILPIAGATVIYVDTTTTAFMAGAPVAVSSSTGTELLLIASIAADSLTVSTPVMLSHAESPYLAPGCIGYMEDRTLNKSFPTELNSLEFSFKSVDTIDVSGYTADETYDSIPVFTRCNLFASDNLSISSEHGGVPIDYDTGQMLYEDFWGYAKPTLDLGLHAESAADVWWVRQFLYYLMGRYSLIWVPTNGFDLVLKEEMLGVTLVLEIVNCWYTKAAFNNELLRYIQITDGTTTVYREIISTEDDGETELLTLDSGVNFSAPVKISFLIRCRANTDVFELEWARSGELFCTLPMIGVAD